jgi:alkanesulfonate monooxygenase SsuD/methylene tetrahydromethanopterin reductase-like flavin-dependent oxidoreductase (luciferase family)
MIPSLSDRIRLDASVLDRLFHSPAVPARRLAKLDQLSGGRLLIRMGQGWMMQDFTAAGIPPLRRCAAVHDMARQGRWGLPVGRPRRCEGVVHVSRRGSSNLLRGGREKARQSWAR